MPPVIKAIAAIFSFGKAIFTAKGILGFVARLAGLQLVSAGLSRLFGKPKLSDSISGVQTMVASTIEPRKLVYGQRRVSGPIYFYDAGGANNRFLYYGILLTGHEVQSIGSIFLDDDEITNGMLDGSGDVISGKYSGKVRILKQLGSDTQVSVTELVSTFTYWTTAHRNRGCANIVVRLEGDDDPDNPTFPNGQPPSNISAIVEGMLVFDSRDGGHDINDPATWAYTDNNALCAMHYLTLQPRDRGGFGADRNDANLSELTAAANVCEQQVEFPGSVFQDRYTCDAALSTESSIGEIKDTFAKSMAGQVFRSQGEWHFFAGEYNAPTISMSEKDFASSMQIQATAPRESRYNFVRGIYPDRDRNYEIQECLPRTNASYVTQDGGIEKFDDIELLMTDNEFAAQLLSVVHLKQSRNQKMFTAVLKPTAIRHALWEVININRANYNWVNKPYRVIGWGINDDGLTEQTFREESSTGYDFAVADGETLSIPLTPGDADPVPSLPTNFQVNGSASGGTSSLVGANVLTWTKPADIRWIVVFVNTTADWATAGQLGRIDGEFFVHETLIPQYYWIVGRNNTGQGSGVVPGTGPTSGILGDPFIELTRVPASMIAGGSWDGVLTPNEREGGTADTYEIRIEATTFEHPDGTTRLSSGFSGWDADDTIVTPYETITPINGRFFVMWTEQSATARFTAPAWDIGTFGSLHWIVVEHDGTDWIAVDNANNRYTFTPIATDVVIAAGTRDGSGIKDLITLLSGIAGADGAAGAAGDDGNSVFVGNVFLRKSTAPSTPVADDGQYNFTTNVLTPPSITGGSADDWFVSVPTGTDPLYVSSGSFEISGPTGIDTTVTWVAPVVLASDGVDGATGGDGNSVHVASAFLRKATAPTKPIDDDGSYNFTTTTLTPPSITGGSADDWFVDVPAGTDPLYVVNGVFEINGTTGTDNTVVWSTPVVLASDGVDGTDGTDGGDGNSVFVGTIYLRKATAPTKPIDDDGSYNFTTNVLTPPSIIGGSADDWFITVPAGTDPLYICNGSFEINGITGTDNTVVWSTPIILASDGADGATGGDGNSVHVGNVFLRKATAPTKPIDDDGSYNFTTTTLTPPSIGGGSADDWFISVPAGTDPLYVSSGIFEINGATGTDNTVVWSTPVILASDGVDGGDGISAQLTNEAHPVPSNSDGSNPDLSDANGLFKVFEAGTDVTTSATFSEVAENNVTGTINTAVDTPVSGQPAGYYEVTAMPDAANSGTYTVRAVYGGITFDKVFSLAKITAPVGVTVNNLSSIREVISPGTATAGCRVLRGGKYQKINPQGSWVDNGPSEWANPENATVGDGYEVKLDTGTGTTPSGPALNTWHLITTGRQWTISRSTIGTNNYDSTLHIRNAATQVELDSGAVALEATVSP